MFRENKFITKSGKRYFFVLFLLSLSVSPFFIAETTAQIQLAPLSTPLSITATPSVVEEGNIVTFSGRYLINGEPIPSYQIDIIDSSNGNVVVSAITDSQGFYATKWIAMSKDTPYEFHAVYWDKIEQFGHTSLPVKVTVTTVSPILPVVSLILIATPSVVEEGNTVTFSGSYTINNKPIPNIIIEIIDASSGAIITKSTTDSMGSYSTNWRASNYAAQHEFYARHYDAERQTGNASNIVKVNVTPVLLSEHISDFSLLLDRYSAQIEAGESATVIVNVNQLDRLSNSVKMYCDSFTSSIQCDFEQAILTPSANTVLKISTDRNTIANDYQVIIGGIDIASNVSHEESFKLTVTRPQAVQLPQSTLFDFDLLLEPNSIQIEPGKPISVNVFVDYTNEKSGTVQLSCKSDSDILCSLGREFFNEEGSTSLNIYTNEQTYQSNHEISVLGTDPDSNIQHETVFKLVLIAPPEFPFWVLVIVGVVAVGGIAIFFKLNGSKNGDTSNVENHELKQKPLNTLELEVKGGIE